MAQTQTPVTAPFTVTTPLLNASSGTAAVTFWGPADRAYKIVASTEGHGVVASSACSLALFKDADTTAPGAGVAILAASYDVHTPTANTAQVGALSVTPSDLAIAVGGRLSWQFTGTLTALVNCTASVTLIPA